MTRRLVNRSLVVAGVGALALLAGCGGDDEPAATQWAGGLCSAITDWRSSVDTTVADLREGVTGEDELRDASAEIEEATESLADDLRGLGRPETEAGQEADATLDELAQSVEDDVETVRTAVDGVGGLADVLEAAATVTATLSGLRQELETAVDELQGLDPGGELEAAFRDADSCADVRQR